MNLLDRVRAERESHSVALMEYIKLRQRFDGIIFVFEGKQCPVFYSHWITYSQVTKKYRQLIARSKKNVLKLYQLIMRNEQESSRAVVFCVDNDFDTTRISESDKPQIYITRGYSIENELLPWSTLEKFILAHFDISNDADNSSLENLALLYESNKINFFHATKIFNHVVFACRRLGVTCTLPNGLMDFIDFQFESQKFSNNISSIDEVFDLFKIHPDDRGCISLYIKQNEEFQLLNPEMDWRGKFNYDFLREFLIFLTEARRAGKPPFSKKSKPEIDPTHTGLFSALAASTLPSTCFIDFCQQNGLTSRCT